MNGQLYELAVIFQDERRREARQPLWIEQLRLPVAFSRRLRPLLGSGLTRLGGWVGGAALRERSRGSQEPSAHDPGRAAVA